MKLYNIPLYILAPFKAILCRRLRRLSKAFNHRITPYLTNIPFVYYNQELSSFLSLTTLHIQDSILKTTILPPSLKKLHIYGTKDDNSSIVLDIAAITKDIKITKLSCVNTSILGDLSSLTYLLNLNIQNTKIVGVLITSTHLDIDIYNSPCDIYNINPENSITRYNPYREENKCRLEVQEYQLLIDQRLENIPNYKSLKINQCGAYEDNIAFKASRVSAKIAQIGHLTLYKTENKIIVCPPFLLELEIDSITCNLVDIADRLKMVTVYLTKDSGRKMHKSWSNIKIPITVKTFTLVCTNSIILNTFDSGLTLYNNLDFIFKRIELFYLV